MYLFWDFLRQKEWRNNNDQFEKYGDMKMHINQNNMAAFNAEYSMNQENVEMMQGNDDQQSSFSEDGDDSKPLLAGQTQKE